MIITNEFKLPQPFVNVANNSGYSKGKAHISATGLLNSPKIITLLKKHDHEIEQDVADTINIIIGDRKSTRLNSSHSQQSRMPSSA